MNKYLKRTLVVASVMIIIFSIIMLWPLPLRKVLRQETDTAMTVSLSDNDTNISSFSLSASSVEYRRNYGNSRRLFLPLYLVQFHPS